MDCFGGNVGAILAVYMSGAIRVISWNVFCFQNERNSIAIYVAPGSIMNRIN